MLVAQNRVEQLRAGADPFMSGKLAPDELEE